MSEDFRPGDRVRITCEVDVITIGAGLPGIEHPYWPVMESSIAKLVDKGYTVELIERPCSFSVGTWVFIEDPREPAPYVAKLIEPMEHQRADEVSVRRADGTERYAYVTAVKALP